MMPDVFAAANHNDMLKAGTLVVSRVSSPLATWIWLIILLTIHLGTNYAAVRAVKMRTLNRQRANLVLSTLMDDDRVLTPEQVSSDERIFERDGILRWKGSQPLGHAVIGVSVRQLLASMNGPRSSKHLRGSFAHLNGLFRGEDYILWYDLGRREGLILLQGTATARTQLKAWAHGLLVARQVGLRNSLPDNKSLQVEPSSATLDVLGETLKFLNGRFEKDVQRIQTAGWDVDTSALVTRPGYRLAKSDRGATEHHRFGPKEVKVA